MTNVQYYRDALYGMGVMCKIKPTIYITRRDTDNALCFDIHMTIKLNDILYIDPSFEFLSEEKIAIFHTSREITRGYSGFNLPSDYYRLTQVRAAHDEQMHVEVEKTTHRKSLVARNSPLTKATTKRPVYYVKGNNLQVLPEEVVTLHVNYIKAPKKVNWTYVVVGEKPLSNPGANDYQNFELHRSEETKLVVKILALTGITLKDPNLYQTATAEDNKNIQQEKQ